MAMQIFLPAWWPLSSVGTLVASLVTAYIVLHQISIRKHDPREPAILTSTVPFLGPLLGMAFFGGKYVKSLGLRNRHLPLFTLPVPRSRIYVVTEPGLAAAVQRASKSLSFTPLIPEATKRILGLDKATQSIVNRHLDPGPGDEWGFLAEIQNMVYEWFKSPGNYLEEVTLEAARELNEEVATFAASGELIQAREEPIDLLKLVQHFVTVSTARFFYGPRNPIAVDPKLEAAFWDFDHGLGMLLINVFPSFTAPRAYEGREQLSAALWKYLEAGHHLKASKIVQKRIEIALNHGWTLEMIAREELSFLFAGIVNATTSTFWILLQIFADPELLAIVRDELEPLLKSNKSDDQANTGMKRRISISDLKEQCPMLVAVYRECLRLGSDNFSTRIVKEDTVLADRYFLKKGSAVQIAGGVIHADQSIWGDNVDNFNPRRFLKNRQSGGARSEKVHPAAFRAFGGGKTLCPGRHFAMNEILSLVALIVLQLDMTAPDGDKLYVPQKNDSVLPVHVLEPLHPVEVLICRRRDGFANSGLNVAFEM
ncbi:cytochrome P450 [Xylariaceae sp. FL0016]|nr:cytochrome P450 [Xylariaceae sp. FL0016]